MDEHLEPHQYEVFIVTMISTILSLITLIVLMYYIRRRYILYQDIRRFPSHLLIFQSYQNHLKNLKIKVLISNFVLLILFLELINNVSYDIGSFLELLRKFISFPYPDEHRILSINSCLRITFVPLLTLFMIVLWLVYRKYEYHYTIRRWVWYIILRFISISVLTTWTMRGYNHELIYLRGFVFPFLHIFDYLQFIYYSRRFYLHLKSRENEIRLFYFDKQAYLESKFWRKHFKVATIFVVVALFFFTFGFSLHHIIPVINRTIHVINPNINVTKISKDLLYPLISIHSPLIILYNIFFSLNYLYIVFIMVYNFAKNRVKKANINDSIKPLINKYHNSIYNRGYNNYV